MEIYHGKSVFGGIAIGRLCLYQKGKRQVKRSRVEDTEQEIQRYHEAKQVAANQLQQLYEKACNEVGEANAAIFEIHQMMLMDEDYQESVEHIIRTQKINAEYAVATTEDNFADLFSSMTDSYMKERAADVHDVSERLLVILGGGTTSKGTNDVRLPDEQIILIAEDLAPSETVQLDKNKILSFVTTKGAANSHTAILARTMGLPSLFRTNIPLKDEMNGRLAIVDGYTGELIVEPDEITRSEKLKKQQEETARKELFKELQGKETVTLDGKKIKLYANIGDKKDLAAVLSNDADGIGLFRSEFLYLERKDFPSEEEQFQVYKAVVETMAGKPVIIRTLDIGADKQCDYFHLKPEENPALGMRAIRICLTNQEVFLTQLRALYRASTYGTLSIMFPMITSVKEIEEIKRLVNQVKGELQAQDIPVGQVQLGIMIETPAAAIISDLLAKEVDFFSIGTNDLTQYLLAIDRQNTELDLFYDPHHPAVLRTMELVVQNAHKAGIWVGICGELGADTSLTEEFVRMGIDELSVSPNQVLPVRYQIRQTKAT